jgi:restriction system protein
MTGQTGGLPPFQTLMRPLLSILEDGQYRHSEAIGAALAREFALDQQQLAQRLRNGQGRFANRVAWALHHLHRALLVESEAKSIYRITDRGRTVLREHPTGVDIAVCAQYPEWQESRAQRALNRR